MLKIEEHWIKRIASFGIVYTFLCAMVVGNIPKEISKDDVKLDTVHIDNSSIEEYDNTLSKNFNTVVSRLEKDLVLGYSVLDFENDSKLSESSELLLRNNGATDSDIMTIGNMLSREVMSTQMENKKHSGNDKFMYNYNSRENLMQAAFSLIGNVRYVWGGGHIGASDIDGTSKIWLDFNRKYGENNNCIKSKDGYCPIHGTIKEISCVYLDEIVRNHDDFENARKNDYELSVYDEELIDKALAKVMEDESLEITAHSLEGLDCSGFVSWCYNQMSTDTVDMTAREFVNHNRFREISNWRNQELVCGDVVSWYSHIVMIVGSVGQGVYVHIEETPPYVMLGVSYTSDSALSDRTKAIEIARQANELIIGRNMEPRAYNLDVVGLEEVVIDSSNDSKNEDFENCGSGSKNGTNSEENDDSINSDSETRESIKVETELVETLRVGRWNRQFIDEHLKYENGKEIKEMNAVEIIQHTIDRDRDRINGIEMYSNEEFDNVPKYFR